MMTYITRSAATLLMFLTLVGCQTLDWEEFDYHADEFQARRLYQPLVSGHEALLERLPNLLNSPVVFALDEWPDVHRLDDDQYDQSNYWDQDKAVFFDIDENPDDTVSEWVWFNPRRMRVEPVEFNEHEIFTMHRSIPEGWRRPVRQRDLDIFQFNFTLVDEERDEDTVEETLAFHSTRQMTYTDNAEFSPVFIHDGDTMIYLVTTEADSQSSHHQLRVKRAKKANEYVEDRWEDRDAGTPVISNQTFDTRFHRLLPDGRLAFAANPDGHYRMYQIRDIESWDCTPIHPEVLEPLEYPIPMEEEHEDYIFGSLGEDGVPMPVLLKLPETYDLPTLLNLLEVYNPHINEKRALLAAALIQARMPKLDNWPILTMGLEYEQAVDIFFDLPRVATGDTLSRELVRMLVGFSQPLIHFRRNAALSEAGMWQARIAADLVDKELNERVAEVSELYFEATYLQELLAIQDELIATSDRKTQFFKTLRDRQEAIRLQLMAVAQVREGQNSERHFTKERLAFVKSRIKELCGIPELSKLTIEGEKYRFADYEAPSLDELRDVAQLNHPRINIARHQLSQSFYLKVAGHRIRPGLNLVGTYTATDRDFDRVSGNDIIRDNREDEFINLGLGASVPTASRRARKYHRGYWDHVINAQQLERDAEIRAVDTQLNEAYLDFKAAQWDMNAKASSAAYSGEKLRVTRVQAQSTPAGGLGSASDLFRDANVADRQGRFDQLSPYTVRMEYLEDHAAKLKVEMDLGLRFVKLLREQGIARTAADELQRIEAPVTNKTRPSIWLWETRRVLSSDAEIDAFIATLESWNAKRVYAYLYWDGRILNEPATREKFTLLLHLCREIDVEVWGLFGEPDWLQSGDTTPLATGVQRVHEFNARFGSYEPVIEGIKLDLEPHSIEGFESDANVRNTIGTNYLKMLDAADQTAGEIPVWADLSVKFFKPEGVELLKRTREHIDGATVMSYFNTENAILKWAMIAAESANVPIEVGMELNSNAPVTDRITDWTSERRNAFLNQLRTSMSNTQSYTGVAFHDYTGLSRISNGDPR